MVNEKKTKLKQSFNQEIFKLMKTSLNEIKVKCSECGEESTALDVNNDNVRYHTTNGSAIRLPKDGLNSDQLKKLQSIVLLCECCQEDKEDN